MRVNWDEIDNDEIHYMLIKIPGEEKFSIAEIQSTENINEYIYLKDEYLKPYVYDDLLEATTILNDIFPKIEISSEYRTYKIGKIKIGGF